MNTSAITQDQLDGIAFVGQTFGPLFSEDPKNGNAASLYEAFAAMVEKLVELTKTSGFVITFTVSCDPSELPERIHQYMISF